MAEILPFPRSPARAQSLPFGRLHSAMEKHREALARWRYAMAELQIGVAGLSASLHAFEATLGELEDRIAAQRHAVGE